MISYPCVTCDRKKLLHNLNTLAEQMHKDNHIFAAVIKGFSADDDIIHIIEESDCDWIADSRIEDLLKLSTKKNRFLIRLSQLSEIPNVILGSDVSFESEVTTIQALQEEAKRQNVTHGIILAIDMGDLREGCFFQNLAGGSSTIPKDVTLVLGNLAIVDDMGIDDNSSIPIGFIPLSQEVINLSGEVWIFLYQVKIIIYIVLAPVQIVIACNRGNTSCSRHPYKQRTLAHLHNHGLGSNRNINHEHNSIIVMMGRISHTIVGESVNIIVVTLA